MTPATRIKCTAAATPHAYDLWRDLHEQGKRLLGSEPGSEYAETMCGHRFIAYRLKCGGIEVRQVMPKTRSGWAELEGKDAML